MSCELVGVPHVRLLFFSAEIELGGSSVAVRAGAQLGVSVTSSMSHFFFAKIELGGSSVAVRAGFQLGVSVTSSMSSNSI